SLFCFSFLYLLRLHRYLLSFPTRRSSDLDVSSGVSLLLQALCQARTRQTCIETARFFRQRLPAPHAAGARPLRLPCFGAWARRRDRKSTRLNSSHVKISYAVFCLKKKIST